MFDLTELQVMYFMLSKSIAKLERQLKKFDEGKEFDSPINAGIVRVELEIQRGIHKKVAGWYANPIKPLPSSSSVKPKKQ